NGPDKSRDDHGNDRLEGETLRLLDTLSPSPQMLKIRPQLPPIALLDAKGHQGRRDGLEHDGTDIFALQPLLLSQRLCDNCLDILLAQHFHRLMIRATFSNVRLPK